MTVAEWLSESIRALKESGCPDPEIDARWIAEDILGMTTVQLRFEGESDISDANLAKLDACIKRRVSGEPVQYILGSADFMGERFYVDERVLIPRADTETLVENVVIALQGLTDPDVLDLCTGSGAIGLSVKNLVPHAKVTLTDLSHDALEVAAKNARLLETDVTLRHGDLFKAVHHEKFDLIASNPPYIPTHELSVLQKEVTFEPRMALDGGEDGLDIYRRILADAPAHLKSGGQIFLEVGIDEADAVLALARKAFPGCEGGTIRDLSGIERVVWIRSR